MSDKLVGIGTLDQTAVLYVGEPCYERKRKQLHIRSPKSGHWIVSMTDKQAKAFCDAVETILEGRRPIGLVEEEVTNE